MLSKEMYALLQKVPRNQDPIAYSELIDKDKHIDYRLISEALNQCGYLRNNGNLINSSTYSITEKGQAALEEYEQFSQNQRIMKTSLAVARIAMWAAIASAVSAIAAFIKLII